MNQLKKVFFLIFFYHVTTFSFCQVNERVQISLITCSPGNELYSIFGHTAIRIVDSTNGTDLFYNYGTFDFNDPDFYSKFTHGKLDYYLNTDNGNLFFRAYQEEGRTITEQVLKLTAQQKLNIQQSLLTNLQGSNKFYKYDFLFDNCTTRARDVLIKNGAIVNNFQLVKQGTTFRNMLYQYLDSGGMCWSKLGIDILLGSKIDVPVTKEQSSFLPDYLMFVVDSNHKKSNTIEKVNVYNKVAVEQHKAINYLPFFIFLVLALFIVFCYQSKSAVLKQVLFSYSNLILFFTGVIGCLLLFMWFGTDHKSCANNYNLSWALPTNLIALFINKKSSLAKSYFSIVTIISLLLLLCWFFLPQQFNLALFPFVCSNLLCYKFLWDRSKGDNND